MELEISLTEIPSTSSLVLELEPEAKAVEELFEELGDFRLADPSSFQARLRLQRVGESVRVAGEVKVDLVFECGRCLSERIFKVKANLEYLVMPRAAYEATYGAHSSPHAKDEDDDGVQLKASDLDVSFFEGEELDLRPYLRESVLLETPSYATCELVGLDEECDKAYEALQREAFKDHEESKIADPRWAPLLALQQGDKDKKN